MIRFQQVSLMRGVKPLLESVDVTLNPGDKIGLIGANGAGKSSLFGLLRGELHADQGEIDYPAKWRVAYVAQETPPLDRAALDYAIEGDGTLLIISHDRDFLDEVVNVIVHIDERKLKRYSGNYSGFERQRAAQMILAQGAMEKQNRQRAHLESFVNRFKAQASKARQAQSRMKALEKMAELAPIRAAAEFSFEFREPLNAPNPLLVMEDVNAGYHLTTDIGDKIGEKIIVNGINFS